MYGFTDEQLQWNSTNTSRLPGSSISKPSVFEQLLLPTFTCSLYAVCVISHVQLFLTCQAPLSMEFSRQEYWSGLSFPTPGDLPDPGIEPTSVAFPALAGRFFTTASVGKPRLVPGTYSLNRQKKKKKKKTWEANNFFWWYFNNRILSYKDILESWCQILT